MFQSWSYIFNKQPFGDNPLKLDSYSTMWIKTPVSKACIFYYLDLHTLDLQTFISKYTVTASSGLTS